MPLIVGLYLVLAGLARFVEESYRGEPQTPVLCGLRLYQWLAPLSVGAGALVMSLRTVSRAGSRSELGGPVAAVLMGIACWFAMGVDFPTLTRRFSRLA